MAALEYWAANFPVANHGWLHLNLNKVTVEQYQEEISLNEALLARLSPQSDWRWFRYPFLAEGDDPAKRLAIRSHLVGRGYKIAAVTMDFSDWAYNDPYARCAAKGDSAAIAALEKEWLAAARHRALAARKMAKELYGRDIPYVLLTHVGALDARMFPRMIKLYQEMGFRIVPLEEAQRDPVYAQDNDPSLPQQPWTLEGRMAARGLPLPPARTPAVDLNSICM
jgi:peptidoglycan/xylan/chitin deacetylase (PgdA/CDA1 family)